jgi:SAM-dependent methyltransferase
MKKTRYFNAALILLIFAAATVTAQQPQPTPRTPDVPYVPTSQSIVDAMLKLAKVTKADTVYDLGCGDGRIVITAAKQFGASGVGIDINPERIKEANANAVKAGVTKKVKFIEGDLFETDFSNASVVTLYLLPAVNLKLRPKLLEQLKPGTRIVSHSFDMGDWQPEQTVQVDGATIYFWTIPADKKAVSGK